MSMRDIILCHVMSRYVNVISYYMLVHLISFFFILYYFIHIAFSSLRLRRLR